MRNDSLEGIRYLLGPDASEQDVRDLARRNMAEGAKRSAYVWRPWLMRTARLEGLEHLEDARRDGKGVVVAFLHVDQYLAVLTTIARHGFPGAILTAGGYWDGPPPGFQGLKLRQQRRYLEMFGNEILKADRALTAIPELLRGGGTIYVALDVAGKVPTKVLGRTVLIPDGVAMMGALLGAPIVCAVARREGSKLVVRVEPPLRSSSPEELQEPLGDFITREFTRRPEAVEIPQERWTQPAEEG